MVALWVVENAHYWQSWQTFQLQGKKKWCWQQGHIRARGLEKIQVWGERNKIPVIARKWRWFSQSF